MGNHFGQILGVMLVHISPSSHRHSPHFSGEVCLRSSIFHISYLGDSDANHVIPPMRGDILGPRGIGESPKHQFNYIHITFPALPWMRPLILIIDALEILLSSQRHHGKSSKKHIKQQTQEKNLWILTPKVFFNLKTQSLANTYFNSQRPGCWVFFVRFCTISTTPPRKLLSRTAWGFTKLWKAAWFLWRGLGFLEVWRRGNLGNVEKFLWATQYSGMSAKGLKAAQLLWVFGAHATTKPEARFRATCQQSHCHRSHRGVENLRLKT